MEILDLSIIFLAIVNSMRLVLLTLFSFSYNKYLKKNQLKKVTYNSSYRYRPLLSVVVAAFNEELSIQRTLKHIFNSTYSNFEVVLVNDGSTDTTEQKVLEYITANPNKRLTYVNQKNGGKAHALNNGIKNYAKGKLIMCLDADSILRPDAIANAVKYFRSRSVKAIATNVKIIHDLSPLNIIQQIEYLVGYHLKKALTVSNMEYIVGGVGSTFRSSILKRVGYYDTDTITEDIDLTMKIVALGNIKNRIVFASDVVAYTESPLTLYALFRQRYRWKFGRFQTFWKNRKLFFSKDKKYSKQLTNLYLPFQLYSELAFLLDPIFFVYIFILCLLSNDFSSYAWIFLFVMFFSTIGVSTDDESSFKDKLKLMLLTPFAYIVFFVVSVVEYFGLIKSIINWKRVVYLNQYQKCSWVPVQRLGKDI